MADQITFNALRALDANGDPAAGAKAYFYESGTSTPVTVYTDTALSVAAASPLVADANGEFDQVFYNGAVALKVVVDDADDVELFTLDPVAVSSTTSAAASAITFTPTADIAQSNVQDAIEQVQANWTGAKTGSDDGLVSGTAGAADNLAKWNGDGDLVDSGFGVLDEDDFASDSATDVPTQQSAKAYIDGRAMPQRATAQATTSGTEFDFTSIPSWVKRITVLFDVVSLSGTDDILVQLGDSGGVETSGYTSVSMYTLQALEQRTSATNGFNVNNYAATDTYSGRMTIENVTGNVWVAQHLIATGDSTLSIYGSGRKELSATLDRLRVTRSGSNTFDGGQVNIFYE